MSECVVRMEMPAFCYDCPIEAENGVCNITRRSVYEDRPQCCPIIAVLPKQHGRLVDAAAYCAEMKTRQDACKEEIDKAIERDDWELYDKLSRAYAAFTEAKLTLDSLPTIIPATEGGNHEAD